MTNQEAQPASFRFDAAKSFADNCRAFLDNLENVDADMAVILRDNWDLLVTAVSEGERDSKVRGELNSKVATALDLLTKPVDPKAGA